MKKILILVLMTVGLATAQEQVLFSNFSSHGGFGGPVLKLSQFNDDLGLLVGGRGGWIIGQKLTLGGGAYGLVNDIPILFEDTDSTRFLDFNYGGFEMGIIIASNSLVHFSVNSLIGGGEVRYRNAMFDEMKNEDYDWESKWDHDQIFVFEPSVNVILNLSRWARAGFGASYRYVSGVDLHAIDDALLTGPAAVLTLKFGSF